MVCMRWETSNNEVQHARMPAAWSGLHSRAIDPDPPKGRSQLPAAMYPPRAWGRGCDAKVGGNRRGEGQNS